MTYKGLGSCDRSYMNHGSFINNLFIHPFYGFFQSQLVNMKSAVIVFYRSLFRPTPCRGPLFSSKTIVFSGFRLRSNHTFKRGRQNFTSRIQFRSLPFCLGLNKHELDYLVEICLSSRVQQKIIKLIKKRIVKKEDRGKKELHLNPLTLQSMSFISLQLKLK